MKTVALAAALLMAASPVLMGCAGTNADKTAQNTDTAKAKPAGMMCIRRMDIDGWGMRHDGKMVVSTAFNRKYLLSLAGWCQDFDFSFGASFQSPGHVQDMCLDRGDYVMPIGNDISPPGARCYITKVERYTKKMQADYKKARAAAKAEKAKARAEKAAAEAKKAADAAKDVSED